MKRSMLLAVFVAVFSVLLPHVSAYAAPAVPTYVPAVVNDNAPFIKNDDPAVSVHWVLCHENDGDPLGGARNWYWAFESLVYHEYSPRWCYYLLVDNMTRTLYMSVQTRALYWTDCGEKLPIRLGDNSGGLAYFSSNSVQLLKTVRYPTAPAQGCDSDPRS